MTKIVQALIKYTSKYIKYIYSMVSVYNYNYIEIVLYDNTKNPE